MARRRGRTGAIAAVAACVLLVAFAAADDRPKRMTVRVAPLRPALSLPRIMNAVWNSSFSRRLTLPFWRIWMECRPRDSARDKPIILVRRDWQ